jgi:hypothetical protein
LDWMNFIRILKESNFSLTSHGVWNGGMKFSFPMEMLAFLHEMEEIKHRLRTLGNFFLHVAYSLCPSLYVARETRM